MADLVVHDVEEQLVEELKSRAARNGRSVEDETREILRDALEPVNPKPRLTFWEYLSQIPNVGEDSDFERVDDFGRDVEW